jgi:hypothetical protein
MSIVGRFDMLKNQKNVEDQERGAESAGDFSRA